MFFSISTLNEMNTKLKILIVDNCVATRQTVSDAIVSSYLDGEVEQADGREQAIAHPRLAEFDCIFVAERVLGNSNIASFQTAGVNGPILLITEQIEEFSSDSWRDLGIIDVVAENEINSLTIARLIRNAIRVFKSDRHAEYLRQELRDRHEQISAQAQIIAAQRVQINQKNIELIAASQLKSQFLATISHELRTPMHAIQGFSQLLLRMQAQEHVPVQQRDMVERIYKNSQQLLFLLGEILDFGKLEAGTLDLQPQFFDLAAAINDTAEEVKPLAQTKNLSLRVKNNLKNSVIYNDQMRIRQITINLLSNGIKFTDSGCVCIELEELPAEGLAIIVRDTGIGIDSADVENIFDVFHQLDNKLARKYPGIGMGLAIVNALVYMMQGRIIVSSEPGQGSTFRIEIPRQLPSPLPSHLYDASLENSGLTNSQIHPQKSSNWNGIYPYPQQDMLILKNRD